MQLRLLNLLLHVMIGLYPVKKNWNLWQDVEITGNLQKGAVYFIKVIACLIREVFRQPGQSSYVVLKYMVTAKLV